MVNADYRSVADGAEDAVELHLVRLLFLGEGAGPEETVKVSLIMANLLERFTVSTAISAGCPLSPFAHEQPSIDSQRIQSPALR